MARLFVAVEIPAPVRAALVDRLQPWQADLSGWRWTDPARWHLTLAFLGDVEERSAAGLPQRLRRASRRHDGFDVGLNGLGAFSRPARAQVLMVGVVEGRQPLGRLAASVSAAARRCKIDVDDRPYRPHVTLARRRVPTDLRGRLDSGASLGTPTWSVGSFVLVESHLGAQVRHDVVERFALGTER
ncbi:MAG TPA: RNA 2',3'-cyclic phosphodiesterase [Nocardioidaceae bacterium]|nr:RNA 2',3'-cyclic phosphodiesterase [Nocardioidaceae bacterium]